MSLTSSILENGEIVINSGSQLTIETAADFQRLLRESLAASQHVAVELDPAVEIDLTGLQLFCSACKTAAAHGKSFTCSGPRPQAFDDLIHACGAERHTACKQHTDAHCPWFGGIQ